jgi:cell division protein FtsN
MKPLTVFLLGSIFLLGAGCTVTHVDRDGSGGSSRSSGDSRTERDSDTRRDADYDREVDADSSGDSAEITFEFFHERLSPHGEWVEVGSYGWCWYPHEVEVDWRPYSHGNWLYTDDCGWYWHSDYEWSWAGEHYGRWTYSSSRWYWVPGYEWSGGWVAWRDGSDYCGWAPLPPHAHWEVGVGIRTSGFNYEVDIHEASWVFVAHADFTHTSVHTVMLGSHRNSVIIRDCRYAGSVSVSGGVIVNHAITLEVAVRFTGKKIERRKLHSSGTLGGAKASSRNGEIRVFKPRVRKSDEKRPQPADKERNASSERKTMKEKHDAEDRDQPRKNEKSDDRKSEREDLDKRQKRENDDLDKRHGRESDKQPNKEPARESNKKPDRKPTKETGKKPVKESSKDPAKKPVKKSGKDSEEDTKEKNGKGGGKK